VKILNHEKSGKPISIQAVHLLFYGKVNIAAVIDSGYKLLLEKHNNPDIKKTEILCKIMNCLKFFGKFKLDLKEHD